jgi:uncharacterized protein YbjT (DUF2867 family)
MIVVSGAGGKTGRALVRALAARGAAVRAWVRRETQAEGLRALGAAEVVSGDVRAELAQRSALTGARAVYHICPNVHPDELAIGQGLLAAARSAGLEHFVFHSVLHPQTEAMPHHWQKLQVEAALFESGLAFTILQPAPYMQNTLAGWEAARTTGVFRVPYPVATCLSLVDLDDVAEAAARVLTEPGHAGATYEVVGTPGLTQTAVAAEMGRALGRPVEAEAEPQAAWERRARAGGMGDYQATTLLAMFRYYERYGLWGSPSVLTWLLGRPPATYADFARRVAAGQAT